jgi:hypothetical protein
MWHPGLPASASRHGVSEGFGGPHAQERCKALHVSKRDAPRVSVRVSIPRGAPGARLHQHAELLELARDAAAEDVHALGVGVQRVRHQVLAQALRLTLRPTARQSSGLDAGTAMPTVGAAGPAQLCLGTRCEIQGGGGGGPPAFA